MEKEAYEKLHLNGNMQHAPLINFWTFSYRFFFFWIIYKHRQDRKKKNKINDHMQNKTNKRMKTAVVTFLFFY